jgi:hypothetical protein
LQKVEPCVGGAVEENSALSWGTHASQKIVFSVFPFREVAVLEHVLQGVGIDFVSDAEFAVNIPLVYLLRDFDFGFGGVTGIVLERVEDFSAT